MRSPRLAVGACGLPPAHPPSLGVTRGLPHAQVGPHLAPALTQPFPVPAGLYTGGQRRRWCPAEERAPVCPCSAPAAWGGPRAPYKEAFCERLRCLLGGTLPNIYLESFTFAFHAPPYTQMDVFPINFTPAKAGSAKAAGNIILNVRDLKYNLFRARSDSDHS